MRSVAIVLALVLFPGMAEAVEDVAHLVAEGHTLHASAIADDGNDAAEHTDSEHGCSALFHMCGCHTPLSSMTSARLVVDRDAVIEDVPSAVFADDWRWPHDGVLGDAFRPPIG
ncbi:MAG: hypothetical protein A2138_15105 [Deltaproteobacteria bacterium RBG_16_71_12]|nr:MAG: hypothetical protein A2138_15105 [Deltaproteobacteria bacterium RBG_16_71_12]